MCAWVEGGVEGLRGSFTADHIHGSHANTVTYYGQPTPRTVYDVGVYVAKITAGLHQPWKLYPRAKSLWTQTYISQNKDYVSDVTVISQHSARAVT